MQEQASTEYATWVQAVGSVLAVYVAVRLAAHQSLGEVKSDRRRASQRLDAIARLVDAYLVAAQQVFNDRHPDSKNEDRQFEGSAYARLEEASEAIRAIALDQLPSDVAVTELLSIRATLRDINPMVEAMKVRILTVAEWSEFLSCLGRLDISILNIRSEADRAFAGHPLRHSALLSNSKRRKSDRPPTLLERLKGLGTR